MNKRDCLVFIPFFKEAMPFSGCAILYVVQCQPRQSFFQWWVFRVLASEHSSVINHQNTLTEFIISLHVRNDATEEWARRLKLVDALIYQLHFFIFRLFLLPSWNKTLNLIMVLSNEIKVLAVDRGQATAEKKGSLIAGLLSASRLSSFVARLSPRSLSYSAHSTDRQTDS